ncbi:MAG: glycosyltransferase [Bacteroidales bacterium]|nr:glycosyltransferase [Bacteroidales bacterium]
MPDTELVREGDNEHGHFRIERCMPVAAPLNPTFRTGLHRTGPCAVNVSSRNICEIGSMLAEGFLRYTNWSYWGVMTADPSWLLERHFWKLDYKDVSGREYRMLDDLILSADVLHLNSIRCWEFLKRLGPDLENRTKIVMHHHGANLREEPQIAEEERDAGWEVVVSTPDLLRVVPWAEWLPSPIDLEEIDGNYPQWEKPECEFVVGHGYTVPENKGTYDIMHIMEHCKRRDKTVRFVPWSGIGKRQSLWLISQCDVYFATLLYGPGVATMEALAMGVPVLASCTEEELEHQMAVLGVQTPDGLPWIYCTRETAGEWVEQLRTDPELRRVWGLKGRRYVEEFHSIPAVVARAKAIYERTQPCREVLYSGE